MIAKELMDARWKAVIGMVLAAVTLLLGVFTYDLMRSALKPEDLSNVPSALSDLTARLSNYSAFVWGQTYSVASNNGIILLIVAALLGASLIANEVSKGTIFLLLSRPLTRDHILATKYLVGAAVLLGMNALSGALLAVGSLIAGHPQNLGGIATSALLFWLGTLFVLGISTLFSVVFNDVLRPLALTVGVIVLLSLPGLFPNGSDWVLPSYWTSFPAFMGQEFPTRSLLISLVAAIVPIALAVPLFRKQEY